MIAVTKFAYDLGSLYRMNKKNQAKVIRLPGSYFDTKNQRPLTKMMMATLLHACIKQRYSLSFGQAELGGSFSALVARGLLKHKKNNHFHATWFVTDEAFEILHNLGVVIHDRPLYVSNKIITLK